MTDAAITLEPGLYVTATPIGNLGDITYRAVAAMKAADLILCEDTRRTAKLCAAYDIKTPRLPYHDHNAASVRPEILKRLQEGAAICLVSDAGTPLIADPGYKLVREARAKGVAVHPLPGACAAITALCAAGAPSDRFSFVGFPPARSAARTRFFEDLRNAPGVLVFYEAGTRIADSLADMGSAFGQDRTAIIARELTKLHEEFREGALSALAAEYENSPAKGEFVILLPPGKNKPAALEDIDEFLRTALASMSVKDAAAATAEAFGTPRREAYARALALSKTP